MSGKNFRLRYCTGVLFVLCLFLGGVWAMGYAILPADFLAWYFPFQAYPQYAERGYFVQNFGMQDGLLVSYANLSYLHQSLRAGAIPLWNPLDGLGQPAAALHGNGFLFPLHWLTYGLLEPLLAWHLEILLVIWLAAVSTFELLRRLSGSERGAAFGATAWAFGGWLCAYLMMVAYTWCLALFPAALLSVERHRAGGRWALSQLALCCAGMLLGGHLQASVPALGLTALFILWRSPRAGKPWLFAAMVGGVLMASPHLVPLVELLKLSERPPNSLSLVLDTLLLPREYLCMIFPTLLGQPSDNFYFGSYLASTIINGREHCVFIGVVPLGLAVLAAWRGRSGSQRGITGLVLLGLLMAGAPWLYGPLCRLVPPLLFVTAPRFLPFVLFGICILASFGWASLEQRPLQKGEARGLLALLAAFGVGAATFIFPAMSYTPSFQQWLVKMAERNSNIKPPHFHGDFASLFVGRVLDHFSLLEPTIAVSLIVVGASAALCWLGVGRKPNFAAAFTLLALDLAVYFFSMNVPVPRSIVFPQLPDVANLAAGSTLTHSTPGPIPGRVLGLGGGPEASIPLVYGIFNLEGYQSVLPGDYRAVIEAINQGRSLPYQSCAYMGKERLGNGTLDVLGVNKLYNRFDQWDQRYGAETFHGGVSGLTRAHPLRAFLLDKYKVSSRAESLSALLSEGFDPRAEALVERAPGYASPEQAHFQDIPVASYAAQRISFELSAEHPALLVLTDLAYPGWTAIVNGRSAPLLKAYGFARAVEVPSGPCRVELSFRPTGFPLTVPCAALTLLALLLADRRAARRASREATPSPGPDKTSQDIPS